MDERIVFVIYHSCENRVSVGCVSVFELRGSSWHRWGMCRGLGSGSGGVVSCLCEL